tara:strand:+ start:694 stop:1014 length:321 start_codon:yes stop_codon:yes gene_type:complete
MAKKYIIVQTHTNKDEISREISRVLIEKKLVSCVNIYPAASSIFRYNNRIIEENEYLLQAKTTADKFLDIKTVIEQLHNYETPEIISIAISDGNADYLTWINNEIS